MKHDAILANIGHFDAEIDVEALRNHTWRTSSRRWTTSSFRTASASSCWRRAAREPRLRDRASELRHVELVHEPGGGADRAGGSPGKYENRVYVLPKKLDEKVARLHLAKLGATLTRLSEEQSEYLGVPAEGPLQAPSTTATDGRGRKTGSEWVFELKISSDSNFFDSKNPP